MAGLPQAGAHHRRGGGRGPDLQRDRGGGCGGPRCAGLRGPGIHRFRWRRPRDHARTRRLRLQRRPLCRRRQGLCAGDLDRRTRHDDRQPEGRPGRPEHPRHFLQSRADAGGEWRQGALCPDREARDGSGHRFQHPQHLRPPPSRHPGQRPSVRERRRLDGCDEPDASRQGRIDRLPGGRGHPVPRFRRRAHPLGPHRSRHPAAGRSERRGRQLLYPRAADRRAGRRGRHPPRVFRGPGGDRHPGVHCRLRRRGQRAGAPDRPERRPHRPPSRPHHPPDGPVEQQALCRGPAGHPA